MDGSFTMDTMNEEDSLMDENKLEITRNPFDSNLYEKDNFPMLDASIFTDAKSPERKSTGSSGGDFRWSIDQIAKMKPADLDMCPNQEYSVVYERKEDEERDQRQVDEYFKNVLLPSPWLENRADILKRVTFSPHPPATRYIHAADHEDSEQSMNQSETTSHGRSLTTKSTSTREMSCQTTLTLPCSIDLVSMLGKEYFSYVDETFDNFAAKEISATSLRRKLFEQDTAAAVNTPIIRRTGGVDRKESNTPGYVTSSPSKEQRASYNCSQTTSDERTPSLSPYLGIARLDSSDIASPCIFNSNSIDCSPIKQASNVGTPVGKRRDISFSSVDVSPIGSCEKQQGNGNFVEDVEESNYSFLPDVSIDLNATDESVFESSRAARFASPDLSPIGNAPEHIRSNTGIDSMELPESSNLQQQSIKESTARNILAFSGLELSSIVESASTSKFDDIQEDKGPLDITELEGEEENAILLEADCKGEGRQEDSGPPLEMSDFLETTRSADDDNQETPKPPPSIARPNINTPTVVITPTTPDHSNSFVATPLKGILKRREIPSSANSNGSSAEETKFNTERNSGRARNRILQSLDNLPKPVLDDFEVVHSSLEEERELKSNWPHGSGAETSSLDDNLVCRRALSAMKRSQKLSGYLEEEIFDKENNSSPWQPKHNLKHRRKYQMNSTAVVGSGSCSSGSLSNKFCDLSKFSTDDVFDEEGPVDSGVASMDWAGEPSSLKKTDPNLFRIASSEPVTPKNELKSFSISPLMTLKQLSLRSGSTPWSQRKLGSYHHHRSPYMYRPNQFLNRSASIGGGGGQSPLDRTNQPFNSRVMLYNKSHSWPNKGYSHRISSLISPVSKFASPTVPVALVPRSRVTPHARSNSLAWNSNKKAKTLFKTSDEISSYKDFLPSPLK